MTNELTGRTAVVTGAARGIGRACAVRLAELGADVAVVDLDLRSNERYEGEPPGPATEQIEALGRRSLGVQADLTLEEQARGAIRSVVEAWGTLDILVNVAGGAITPFSRSKPSITPSEDVRTLLDVNLMSTIYCCQEAAAAMRAAGRGGAIVNTSSTAAFSVPLDGANSAYAMAKAAVAHYTRHLAAELGPEGIRVNMFAPGITLTGRVVQESAQTGYADRAAEVPMRRLGTPQDCAEVVAFLAGNQAGFVTGRCLPVDGGWILNAC